MSEESTNNVAESAEGGAASGEDLSAKLKAIEAEKNDLAAKAKKLEEADKKRKSEERKKTAEQIASKAIEDGKAKVEIESLSAELAAAKEKAEALEAAEKARIDRLIETLPEEARKKVNAIKDDLSLPKLAELVDMESQSTGKSPAGNAPPPANPGARKGSQNKRELQPRTYEIYDKLNRDHKAAEQLDLDVDEATGSYVFKMPIKRMLARFEKLAVKPRSFRSKADARNEEW